MDSFIGILGAYSGICIIIFLFFAILWFVVSLILRPLIIWYFKINTMIEYQESINSHLSELVSQNEKLLMVLSKQSHSMFSDDTYKDHERYMPK